MAKSKNQKRKAKLSKRSKKHFHFQSMRDLFRVDGKRMKHFIPDEQKRLSYIRALIADFDRMIGVE